MVDETIGTGLSLDPAKRYQTGSAWLEALEDLHCEMRRKPRLNVLDRTLMRIFERFRKRGPSRRTPRK